jgi:hypothetical protein
MGAARVVTPVAVVRDESGNFHHFYQGAAVPEGFDQEDVDRLVGEGFLVEDEDVAEVEEDDAVAAPAKSASKADWVDFVVANYELTEDEANAKTKDELVAEYGD